MGEQDQEKLLQTYTDLLKYTDVNDTKVFGFMWKLFRSQGLFAKAMKLAVKQLEDKPSKELESPFRSLQNSSDGPMWSGCWSLAGQQGFLQTINHSKGP